MASIIRQLALSRNKEMENPVAPAREPAAAHSNPTGFSERQPLDTTSIREERFHFSSYVKSRTDKRMRSAQALPKHPASSQ
jgi:hypothetical protein